VTPVRLLDLSRLLSRAGTMPTGIDRVEAAYLRYFLNTSTEVPCYGLVRTAIGFVLLDAEGMNQVQVALETAHWPFPDPLSLLNPRLTPAMRRGQTCARRARIDRCTRGRLTNMLQKRFPDGFDYYNVGHANLIEPTQAAIRATGRCRVNIMVHDTIPLDHPEWQRPGSVEIFRRKLTVAARHADRIITTARATRRDVIRHIARFKGKAEMVVAPLGVRPVTEDASALPPDLPPIRPYFVTVGTIEPRKNHQLLFDVWDTLGEDGPELVICGSRGWRNDAVFRRLDAGVPNVREVSGLRDDAIAALLRGSQGLLFPSYSEGFGLPPIEAAMLGVPVVASNLPIYEEFLGDWAVYLPPNDIYSWKKEVERLASTQPTNTETPFQPPTWAEHFKIVFTGSAYRADLTR